MFFNLRTSKGRQEKHCCVSYFPSKACKVLEHIKASTHVWDQKQWAEMTFLVLNKYMTYTTYVPFWISLLSLLTTASLLAGLLGEREATGHNLHSMTDSRPYAHAPFAWGSSHRVFKISPNASEIVTPRSSASNWCTDLTRDLRRDTKEQKSSRHHPVRLHWLSAIRVQFHKCKVRSHKGSSLLQLATPL